MSEVPALWQPEIRLGLQEALVNAVRHGNGLDLHKNVTVQYSAIEGLFTWIITDQGENSALEIYTPCEIPCPYSEQGRGVFIVHQIFDRVEWNCCTQTLYLEKQIAAHDKPFIL